MTPISYEQAEKMQLIGYKGESYHVYDPRTRILWEKRKVKAGDIEKPLDAPSYEDCFDWIRKHFDLDSAVVPYYNTKKEKTYVFNLYNDMGKVKRKAYRNYETARHDCLTSLLKLIGV